MRLDTVERRVRFGKLLLQPLCTRELCQQFKAPLDRSSVRHGLTKPLLRTGRIREIPHRVDVHQRLPIFSGARDATRTQIRIAADERHHQLAGK